jgi:hypothetical protein
MAYLHDVDGGAGFGSPGCGGNCGCSACRQKGAGLAEFYYEGEGGDRPQLRGYGFAGYPGSRAPRGYGFAGYGESPGPVTRDIRVVVKSYIGPIASRVGSPYCGGFLNPSADLKLRALALATDAGFSENPMTDAKDKHYRLYSARTFTVTCDGGRIVSVVPSPIDTDAGKECIPRTTTCLQAPPLIVSNVTGALVTPTMFRFSWKAKGRPHLGAEPAMQMVCPRTSVYIWHVVNGRIECAGGVPRVSVQLTGSQFPSHRAFVNGALQPPTVPQGPFSNLWVPSGISDPTLVR